MASIMTLNLRYDKADDGINAFGKRVPLIRECLVRENPDIICFQEMTDSMLGAVMGMLPGYAFVGCGREKDLHGEHNSIAFRTGRFTLYQAGTFWLSDTPDASGSRFPDQGSIPRICTWVLLADVMRQRGIACFNTHLHHQSAHIRKLQVDVVLARMAGVLAQYPVPAFLCGDFNLEPSDSLYQDILSGSFVSLVDASAGVNDTFHGFGKVVPKKIDYIFANAKAADGILSARAVRQKSGGVYLSDHDAVVLKWEGRGTP